jgi:L,D-peptidoglycan transpeptidase YkuD (ErfK/YbiS/YcfS/YnhG family)
MTLSRALSAVVVSGLVAACSGDPGSSIPGGARTTTSPPDATEPAAPGANGDTTTPVAGSMALTVSIEGTGQVVSQPAGIACPGQCTARFLAGTTVTLVSTPAEGWRLDAWRGACAGGAASCSVTLSADATVTSAMALLDARWDPSVGANDCSEAWGTAGETLSPCDTVKDDYVVVHKSKRNVALCKSGKLVKNLRSGLGFAPSGAKLQQGDGKTPEGVFYVPRLLPNSTYYKAFLISYPTVADAARGVAAGLITSAQRSQITSAHAACVEPPQDTNLGGDVELHGNGSSQDWTAGCVALDDANIDLLWSSIGVGDSIVVLP